MSTKHKMLATIPMGDPDIGAEQECEITFTCNAGSPDYWNRSGGHWEQGWAAEIEFVSAAPFLNGNPHPFFDHVAHRQESLNDYARDWLESDDGTAAALDAVDDDYEAGREFAADLRADR